MKFLKLVVLSLIVIYGCSEPNKGNALSETEVKTHIDSLLTNWHLDASQANFTDYMGAMDNVSVFIGTDASENWTKQEFGDFCKPYFDKGQAWDFKALERNISLSLSGNIAWFDEVLDTWMGTCIGSGVLEKSNCEWKIKHYVLSVAIPNDDIRAVIEVKHKSDSIFLSDPKFRALGIR